MIWNLSSHENICVLHLKCRVSCCSFNWWKLLIPHCSVAFLHSICEAKLYETYMLVCICLFIGYIWRKCICLFLLCTWPWPHAISSLNYNFSSHSLSFMAFAFIILVSIRVADWSDIPYILYMWFGFNILGFYHTTICYVLVPITSWFVPVNDIYAQETRCVHVCVVIRFRELPSEGNGS